MLPDTSQPKQNHKLIAVRKAGELSQRELAEKIGVDTKTVQRWEAGRAFPQEYWLNKLCEFFGKTKADLGFVKDDAPLEIEKQAEKFTQDQQDRRLLFNVLHKRYKDKLEELEERRSGKDFISLELHECFAPMHLKPGQSPGSRRRERALPEETTIVTVYDQVTRGLLILGKPGAGKTTLLYCLASLLLKRAEQNASLSLPVVLNLSSWAQEQLPLHDWVVKELAISYHIPEKLGQRWLVDGFQLLLDGLDEVAVEARSACIEAINTYQRESLLPFVVCSRKEEYLYLDDPMELTVQSTVIVQPLTPEQIDTYLVDPSLTPLREEARTNATFCDLLKTPLMLNTAVIVYQGKVFEQLPKGSTTVLLKQQMFAYYLHQMLLGLEKQAQIQMRRQLQWLAQQMQQHKLSVFYLEHLQPDWLPEGGLRRLYIWLGVRLPGILIGFLLTCLFNSFFLHYDIADLLVHSLPGAFVGELLSTRYPSQSESSWFQKKKSSRAVLRSAMLRGGVAAAVLIFIDVSINAPFSFFGGLIFGIWSFLLLLLLPPKSSSQRDHFPIPHLISPGKYLWRYVLPVNPWRDGLLIGLLTGVSWGMIRTLTDGLREGIFAGMGFALIYTLSGILTGSTLRKQAMKVPPTEMIELSVGKFWRSLINRNHLNTILLIGFGTYLGLGLSYGSRYGLRYGLIFGVICALGSAVDYWFLVGLFQGLSRDTMPDEEPSSIPNERIRWSGRNGLYLGLIGGTISACIAGITITLSLWLTDTYTGTLSLKGLMNSLYWGMSTGLVTFLTIGIVIMLVKGGVIWWRHQILRFLLWSDRLIPWRYVDLLEEACRYNLLSKEGRKGYRFFHSLFQDYFASLDPAED